LPELPDRILGEALRRLGPGELEEALISKLLPVAWLPGLVLHAASSQRAVQRGRAWGYRIVGTFRLGTFHRAVRAIWGNYLNDKAIFGLVRRNAEMSAFRRLTQTQIVWTCAGFIWLALAVLALPPALSYALLSFIAGLFFLSIVAVRILALIPNPPLREPQRAPLHDQELPVYSVLIPLFREISVLPQLIGALTHLDYPADRLDIKLILEESDMPMRWAVASLRLPEIFEVIVVPAGKPQTKPRALNYALQFARGSLLTIYDAEDIPDRVQLREAAETFAASPNDVACLQARLHFYNASENWLTRQFTIEYATLFNLILPALARAGLPLPLGGTSNHFRTSLLRDAGAWDPFNVTEDADLGLRLARRGFRTSVLFSRTLEEANTRTLNWLKQRSRWLKGFLQTWLVHMRSPIQCLGDLGLAGFWIAQAMTIGVFVSALVHPVFLLHALWKVLHHDMTGMTSALVLLAGLNIAVFLLGHGISFYAGHKALRMNRIRGWWLALLTMPAYWILLWIAAVMALWEFAFRPHHWNKTEHGLSAMQRRVRVRRPAPPRPHHQRA
jgi:cellulose synthase/poly-beta-1,6-N-acetylglucosamine synthase-like glycosyltransferase